MLGIENASSKPKGQELSHAAQVSLDSTQMQVEDNPSRSGAGVAVMVEINTGERRMFSYLLRPSCATSTKPCANVKAPARESQPAL